MSIDVYVWKEEEIALCRLTSFRHCILFVVIYDSFTSAVAWTINWAEFTVPDAWRWYSYDTLIETQDPKHMIAK